MASTCYITDTSNSNLSTSEQKLLTDLAKTQKDEMNTKSNQASVLDSLNHIDSHSDSAFISMILCLIQESSSIAGAITVTADFMTDIADVVNIVTTSENDLGLLFEEADGQSQSSGLTGAERDQMNDMINSLNFLTTDSFTVTTVDQNGAQTKKTYTKGILEYLGDDSAWSGHSPMGDSTDLVRTSVTDIENQFKDANGNSTWGNANAMWKSGNSGILYWANPIETSVGDGQSIESYSPQYSKMMDDFQQINDQTDMQTQTVQYELQQLTTIYQQYQNLTYQMMQSLAKSNMSMVTAQSR